MTSTASCLESKVLVLNKLYTAVRVISARKAFSMLAKDVAEVVSVENGAYLNYDLRSWTELGMLQKEFEQDQHDWIRTPRITIAIPKIIRLLGYDRFPRQCVKLNRRNIYARDRNRCQYCGGHFATRELTLDHVTPRVQGGVNSWANLVCACVRCNTRKGGRTPAQAGMKLIKKPIQPRRNPTVAIRLGGSKYDSWRAFISEAYWTVELAD